MTLTLYTNPMSRGRVARWMLEETGEPYERVVLGYGEGMHTADYLALNPMGKVPAIVHDGNVVTETAAICAYCAEAFPAADLAPRTAAERAAFFRALFFAAGCVEPAVMARSVGAVPPADKSGSVGYGTAERTVDVLETIVAKTPYAAGERFTAADVYVGSTIGWSTRFGMMENRPAFAAYVARVTDRPAYRQAAELDDRDGEALKPAA